MLRCWSDVCSALVQGHIKLFITLSVLKGRRTRTGEDRLGTAIGSILSSFSPAQQGSLLTSRPMKWSSLIRSRSVGEEKCSVWFPC